MKRKHWTQTPKGKERLKAIKAKRTGAMEKSPEDVISLAPQMTTSPVVDARFDEGYNRGYRSAIGRCLRAIAEVLS